MPKTRQTRQGASELQQQREGTRRSGRITRDPARLNIRDEELLMAKLLAERAGCQRLRKRLAKDSIEFCKALEEKKKSRYVHNIWRQAHKSDMVHSYHLIVKFGELVDQLQAAPERHAEVTIGLQEVEYSVWSLWNPSPLFKEYLLGVPDDHVPKWPHPGQKVPWLKGCVPRVV